MRRELIIVLVFVAVVCSAQNDIVESRGKKKKLYYGLVHYWAFLALKAKIIFLIGSFISFWLFAGKAFAFLYYYKNKESCKCPEYHSEKIVLSDESPHFDHKYSTLFNSNPPEDYFPPGSSFSQRPSLSPYDRYSRSMENSVFDNMDIFKTVIKKVDLTELAFDAMNLKKKSCKMRFVCEAEQQAKNNSLLAFSMYMFSDTALMKYKTDTTVNSQDDCIPLGPHCGFTANNN